MYVYDSRPTNIKVVTNLPLPSNKAQALQDEASRPAKRRRGFARLGSMYCKSGVDCNAPVPRLVQLGQYHRNRVVTPQESCPTICQQADTYEAPLPQQRHHLGHIAAYTNSSQPLRLYIATPSHSFNNRLFQASIEDSSSFGTIFFVRHI